jgi:RimJ/RimL family protein N-acetyltransferase
LRPLEAEDLAIFERAYSSRPLAGEHQWFGFSSPGRTVAELGAIGPDGGRLTAVADDERVIGTVFWFRKTWGPAETSWCWELAMHILAAERSAGYGTECLRHLVGYLFDHTLAWRLQAVTDVDNVAVRRMFSRVGLHQEGCLRGTQWREGGWHDQLIYSILRPDWRPASLT